MGSIVDLSGHIYIHIYVVVFVVTPSLVDSSYRKQTLPPSGPNRTSNQHIPALTLFNSLSETLATCCTCRPTNVMYDRSWTRKSFTLEIICSCTKISSCDGSRLNDMPAGLQGTTSTSRDPHARTIVKNSNTVADCHPKHPKMQRLPLSLP